MLFLTSPDSNFLIIGEFLKQCKPFVEEGVHPRVIIRSFRKATQLALDKIKELSVGVAKENKDELRSLLMKCAATAMSSKLIHQQKDFFSKMVRIKQSHGFGAIYIGWPWFGAKTLISWYFRWLTLFKLLMNCYLLI